MLPPMPHPRPRGVHHSLGRPPTPPPPSFHRRQLQLSCCSYGSIRKAALLATAVLLATVVWLFSFGGLLGPPSGPHGHLKAQSNFQASDAVHSMIGQQNRLDGKSIGYRRLGEEHVHSSGVLLFIFFLLLLLLLM
jgi:hypothetical protein